MATFNWLFNRQEFEAIAPCAPDGRVLGPDSDLTTGTIKELLLDASLGPVIDLLVVPIRPPKPWLNRLRTLAKEAPVFASKLAILPTEIHFLIFSHISDINDVVCFGFTGIYFWEIAREFLYTFYLGRCASYWAGQKVVFVGSELKAHDFPPGIFSDEHMVPAGHPQPARAQPWSLRDSVQYSDPDQEMVWWNAAAERGRIITEVYDRGGPFGHAIDYTYRDMEVGRFDLVPRDESWILRNITTREIVRSEAISIKPESIKGPYNDIVSFGHVVLIRACWSEPGSIGPPDPLNICRGKWAGHRFDITTLKKHQGEASKDGKGKWTDVSEEIAKELDTIYQLLLGPDWRQKLIDGTVEGSSMRQLRY